MVADIIVVVLEMREHLVVAGLAVTKREAVLISI